MTEAQPTSKLWTFEELADYCTALRPDLAAQQQDSSLCVSPLIERIFMDGKEYTLKLVGGKWGAGVVRVSLPIQRSPKARITKPSRARKPRKTRVEGYSEDEQFARCIRHYVHLGQAFRIYSDAGVSAEFPQNSPTLIAKLFAKKADRYRTIFERTLLDETSLLRRTPEQIAGMRAYLSRRLLEIKSGFITEDDLYKPVGEGLSEHVKRALRGREVLSIGV